MKSRLVFVDLLRGWATIVMIEVHVFNAFIIPAYKETQWYAVLNYINGLVAPSFIFISGFVFLLASQRKLEEFRTFGSAFWKQLQRIGLIWVIGYALHLPYFSFRRTIHDTTEAGWLQFYQSDVLHCIALGLLILFIARILIHSNTTHRAFLLALGTGIIIMAPFVWDIDFYRFLPPPLAAYISGERYSQFPIFPWLGFMMFGGYAAVRFIEAREAGKEKDFVRIVSMAGLSCVAGGMLLSKIPLQLPYSSVDVRANTFFFAERLGFVFLFLMLCWWYAERRKTESSFVLTVSRESLMVYAGHLLVIYGLFLQDRSLAQMFGGTLGILECGGVTLALILVMIVAARSWGYLKREHMILVRGLSFSAVFVFCYLYFTQ